MKIRKRIYKSISLLLTIIGVLVFNVSIVLADVQKSEEYDYYKEFYSGQYNVFVVDEEGLDVTEDFIKKTEGLFDNEKIGDIKNILAKEKLVMHLLKETVIPMQSYALEQYKIVDDFIATTYAAENNSSVTMDFRASLKGGIWYNPNTDEVTGTSAPVFTVEYMFSTGVGLSCNSVRTGSDVRSGKGYFWATFSIDGFTDAPAPPLYFGTHTMSFYGKP